MQAARPRRRLPALPACTEQPGDDHILVRGIRAWSEAPKGVFDQSTERQVQSMPVGIRVEPKFSLSFRYLLWFVLCCLGLSGE